MILEPAIVADPLKVMVLDKSAVPFGAIKNEPLLRVREPLPSATALPPTPSVAALTVVPPLYVLLPVRVKLPFKVREPPPLTLPLRLKVCAPAATVTAPPKVTGFVTE